MGLEVLGVPSSGMAVGSPVHTALGMNVKSARSREAGGMDH